MPMEWIRYWSLDSGILLHHTLTMARRPYSQLCLSNFWIHTIPVSLNIHRQHISHDRSHTIRGATKNSVGNIKDLIRKPQRDWRVNSSHQIILVNDCIWVVSR